MALDDSYVDLETMKARLNLTGNAHDALLSQAIAAASRAIDNWTGRCFAKSDTPTARVFTARYGDQIDLPDFVSLTEVATDDGRRTYTTVWETTDYDPFPWDAPERNRPYTELRVAPYGSQAFVTWPRGVRITAVWGWPEVPAAIAEAAALQATRLWKRKDAPFGVTGSAELGQLRAITSMDPDVKAIIAPYKRVVGF